MSTTLKTHLKLFILLFTVTALITACSDDDNGGNGGPQLTGNSETYNLVSVSDPAVSGTVEFAERDDGVTVVTIDLNGTAAGGDHPAHIHANTAAEAGGIIIDFENVDGATGMSTTEVSQRNDGTPVSYNDLINFDGYVNVHLSAADLATLIAQGDIGQNALTGNTEEYTLLSRSDPNISGTATFAERENDETLVTIQLQGTTDGGDHPSHIHANSAVAGGSIVVDFTNVNGATGISRTNVSQLNDGTPITYTELLDYNGYVNVHLSPSELSTLIAQGDIGQNELTENSVDYPLASVSDPAISGTATFAERKSGFTLITIQLDGTTAGGDHPSHIHANDAATGGGIVLSFNNVNGETGQSVNHVTMLDDGTEITYEGLLDYNGYINVHLSPADLATLIAQGNIGSNAN